MWVTNQYVEKKRIESRSIREWFSTNAEETKTQNKVPYLRPMPTKMWIREKLQEINVGLWSESKKHEKSKIDTLYSVRSVQVIGRKWKEGGRGTTNWTFSSETWTELPKTCHKAIFRTNPGIKKTKEIIELWEYMNIVANSRMRRQMVIKKCKSKSIT